MPAPFSADFYNFTGGLHTDAGALTQPANTWREGVNVTPMNDGSLERRCGIDWEYNYADMPLFDVDLGAVVNYRDDVSNAIINYEWIVTTGSNSTMRLVVVQNGRCIIVIKADGDPVIGSSTEVLRQFIFTSPYLADTSDSGYKYPAKMSSSGNICWVVAQNWLPLKLEYNPAADEVTATTYGWASIRDFEGVDDALENNERPASATHSHNYNLRNQGWSNNTAGTDYAATYFTANAVYPSNAQTWHYGKDASNVFSVTELDKISFGNQLAPRGHVITNLWFRRDGFTGIASEDERCRFSTVEAFAGRWFFSGIRESKYSDTVFFSQVIGNSTTALSGDPALEFMQKGDPTAEIGSELLPDDGGYIKIRGAGDVLDICTLGDSLIVFATNGVWAVRPGSDIGFTADSYVVDNLSPMKCVSKTSVVKTDAGIFFWAEEGIGAVLTKDLAFSVVNVSENRINIEYFSASYLGRSRAVGAYNNEDKIICWCYDEDAASSDTRLANRHCMLFLNLKTNAFYKYKLPRATATSGAGASTIFVPLVFFQRESDTNADFIGRGFKFLSMKPARQLVYADFRKLTYTDATGKFKDWYRENSTGTSFDAYFVTGNVFAPSNPTTRKTPMYVTTFFKKTETGVDADGNAINASDVTLQTRWDFSDSTTSNKWSDPIVVYRHVRPILVTAPSATFDTGHELVVTRNKIRGRGRALAMKFSAVGDKDMKLLGWSTVLKANDNV